jgi:hypothetical protein
MSRNILSAAVLLLSLSSCIWSEPPTYTEYRPVLLSRESLEKSIVFHEAEKIKSPGKIYFKDNYIFISEQFKGVHIIDNKDPKNPVNKGYINVPGCVDMAIKDDILYVDNATDLVAVNLATLSQSAVTISKRVRDAFPELTAPDGRSLPAKYRVENRPANTVLVGWVK